MPNIVRGPIVCTVLIDGRALATVANRPLSVQVSLGHDLQTSEATIAVAEMPSWAKHWSKVVIFLGMSPRSAYVRFTGYLVGIEYEHYPRQVQLTCRGPLTKTVFTQNSIAGGTDMSNHGAGRTEVQQIGAILDACGLPTSQWPRSLAGTGNLLGTKAKKDYVWAEGESGLAYIQRLDEFCLGYRTFDTASGAIWRHQVTLAPSSTHVLTFTEGVDIFRAHRDDTVLEIKNRIVVTGYNDGIATRTAGIQQANPYVPSGYVSHQLSSALIEKSLPGDAGQGIACSSVASWLLHELNRRLYRVTLTTPRDDAFAPGMTIMVTAPARLKTNERYLIQNVSIAMTENGEFSQVLTCLTGLGSNAPLQPSPVPSIAFGVLSRETDNIGGVPTLVYTARCEAHIIKSAHPIVSYAWAINNSGIPATGSGETFVFCLQTLAGATVSLTVTDSVGLEGVVERVLPAAPQWLTRTRLYASASHRDLLDFSGTQWMTKVVVDHGELKGTNNPMWFSGSDGKFWGTLNHLRTNPFERNLPFWASALHSDDRFTFPSTGVPESKYQVGIGGWEGQVALSNDSGQSFPFIKATIPNGALIKRIWRDAYNHKHWLAMTSTRLYESWNSAASWNQRLAAQAGETFNDLAVGSFAQGVWRIVVACAGGRLLVDANGVVQTFPVLNPVVSNVLCVTDDYECNRFYCIDSYGRTFYHSADGGTALTQRTSIPGNPTVPVVSLRRHGLLPGVIYYAQRTEGMWRTVDGFQSSAGFLRLPEPTVYVADFTWLGVQEQMDRSRFNEPAVYGQNVDTFMTVKSG